MCIAGCIVPYALWPGCIKQASAPSESTAETAGTGQDYSRQLISAHMRVPWDAWQGRPELAGSGALIGCMLPLVTGIVEC